MSNFENKLVVATEHGRIFRFSIAKNGKINFLDGTLVGGNKDGIPMSTLFDLNVDEDGNFWVAGKKVFQQL